MVLVFLDQSDGKIKKSSLEAASYGAKVAEIISTSAEGIVLGTVSDDLSSMGKYGLKKIHTVNNEALNNYDDEAYTHVIAEAVQKTGAKVVIFSNNFNVCFDSNICKRLSTKNVFLHYKTITYIW